MVMAGDVDGGDYVGDFYDGVGGGRDGTDGGDGHHGGDRSCGGYENSTGEPGVTGCDGDF